MLKRPWKIWTLFILCLAMVLPAMGWLTHKALQLDLAEARAQQQADLEEAVGSALWQMDVRLTRLLAPEIARPYSAFQSFTPPSEQAVEQAVRSGQRSTPTSQSALANPSPLLTQPSPYVLLYFELRPDNSWQSPQCTLADKQKDWALSNGISATQLKLSSDRLDSLSDQICYEQLMPLLPRETLPAVMRQEFAPANMAWIGNRGLDVARNSTVVKNTLDYTQVQQQLENAPDGGEAIADIDGESVKGLNGYGQARSQKLQNRRGSELVARDANLQAVVQQAVIDQRDNGNYNSAPNRQSPPVEMEILEGVSQPIWVNRQLLLARRMQSRGQTVVQGCWLDWPLIERELLTLVQPLLVDLEFHLEPVEDMTKARFNRVLATLPVQLVVAETPAAIHPFSPIRVSLLVAWLFLSLATLAVMILLRGVIALSERRAAFVSAVTHELRTPLTTFRIYAEMLAENMVPDAARRQTYLETLKVEADRLSHLVENVLQYARLERGAVGKRRESLRVDSLFDRVGTRLTQHAAQAEMVLNMEADQRAAQSVLFTDPSAVEQILFNLVDNACKYAASATDRRIHLAATWHQGRLRIAVRDHGPGISPREARRLFRPFSKSAKDAANSAPGVGLGLALSRRLARELGGQLQLQHGPGGGAEFALTLPGGD